MKSSINILKNRLLTLVCFNISLLTFAGPVEPPVDDDPIDPVSIDNGVHYIFLIALFVGIFYLIKKEIKLIKE